MPLKDSQPPSANRWQHAHISLVVPIVLFVALAAAVEISVRQQRLSAQSQALQELGESAYQVRTLFEYELNSTLHLATGIEAYIQSKDGKVLGHELAPWLSHLQEHSPHIRDIAIAPGNRVEFVYPTEGNEKAIGLYYPDNKAQWPMVKKAMETHQPVVAGPTELRQGGTGLLYRVPVFLSDGSYWGVVSTVLDFDEIYSAIRKRAWDVGLKIAVQDTDEDNQFLFGETDTKPDYELSLNPPGRHWRMIASMRDTHEADFMFARMGGWLVSLATALALFAILRSIARQHRTALALAESKYRFSQAFKGAPQGMALITQTGSLLDFNTSLRISLGYTRDELREMNFFDLVAPSNREHLQDIMNQAIAIDPTDRQYESILIHRTGKLINVILGLAPTVTQSHEGDWIVQMIDISHRVAFEHLLQNEAQYNQTILNAVADGILIIDDQGVIHSANPACGIIFDGDYEQLPGKYVGHFIQDKTANDIMHHINAHSDNHGPGTSFNYEMRGIKFDSEAISLEVQLSAIIRNNEKLFIVVVRDISERKRLERMKSEFISTVSHELRTPLTAVLGAIRLLASGALENSRTQAEKLISIADQNGKKLARLIDDLLDMDKSLAGKLQFDFKIQPLYPLIIDAIEQNSAYSAQHKVSISLHADDADPIVNVDSHRLQQVLANLLSNAAKFSPENSVVTVSVTHDEKSVKISVRDKGIGIPEHLQENLFQQFYQVDSSNTRQKGGTGLGLAIAKQLMEAMHGSIGVESKEYRGSCFYIELPLVQSTVAQDG